jgi:hypothetical protein
MSFFCVVPLQAGAPREWGPALIFSGRGQMRNSSTRTTEVEVSS